MVGTTTAPAFSTAIQQAASIGVLVPRTSTRLPGTMPNRSVSSRAIRSTVSRKRP
ncbi:hypothetical protein D3C72_2498300 [compost metagenome]